MYSKDLEEHHRKKHLDEKMFSCNQCGVVFSWRENLNKHMRMHSYVNYTCVQCGRGFMDNTSLRVHIRNHHGSEDEKNDKPYKCQVCNVSFKFDFSYEAHVKSPDHALKLQCIKAPTGKSMHAPSTTMSHNRQALLAKKTPVHQRDQLSMKPIDNCVGQASQQVQPACNILVEVVPSTSAPKDGAEVLAIGGDKHHLPVGSDVNMVKADSSEDRMPDNTNQSTGSSPANKRITRQSTAGSKPKKKQGKTVNRSPKKAAKTLRKPLRYDYVMTEEKPFQCEICMEKFRWEISLRVHMQIHDDGYEERGPRGGSLRNRKRKKGSKEPTVRGSRIIKGRADSDEEDVLHDNDYYVMEEGKRAKRKAKEKTAQEQEVFEMKKEEKKAVYMEHGKDEVSAAQVDQEEVMHRAEPAPIPPQNHETQWMTLNLADLADPADSSFQTNLNPSPESKNHVSQSEDNAACNTYNAYNMGSSDTKPPRAASSQGKLDTDDPVVVRNFNKIYRRTKWQIRPYVCRFCCRVITTKAALTMHYLMHTGRSLHSCPLCGQNFPNLQTLVLHHIDEVKNTRFCCSTCGKAFRNMRGLTKHQRFHVVVPPKRLSQGFDQYTRVINIQVVSGDDCEGSMQPILMCDKCKKGFLSKQDFVKHRKTTCII